MIVLDKEHPLKSVKYILFFLVWFIVWLFYNGYAETSKAPKDMPLCQQIVWAQENAEGGLRPDESAAIWILSKWKCNDVDQTFKEQIEGLDKNPVTMAYVCWGLSFELDHKDDNQYFGKFIKFARNNKQISEQNHSDLVSYSALKLADMEPDKREWMYANACKEPLAKLKIAAEHGMFDPT